MIKKIVLIALVHFVFASLSIAKPKYGPDNAPLATPLWKEHSYFQNSKNSAHPFWTLIGYYVPQFNPYSCSVASVAIVLNAAISNLPKTADQEVISQQKLLDTISSENWKDRLSKKGYKIPGTKKALHGIDLNGLEKVTLEAFKKYGLEDTTVKRIHVKDSTPKTLKAVEQDLVEFESSGKYFILANFNQKNFTNDADVGHVSPVGAYNSKKKKVLILDVDREYYEPYWVSLETFVAGMNTKDSSANTNRGYLLVRHIK